MMTHMVTKNKKQKKNPGLFFVQNLQFYPSIYIFLNLTWVTAKQLYFVGHRS